jgi:hypothetical protein
MALGEPSSNKCTTSVREALGPYRTVGHLGRHRPSGPSGAPTIANVAPTASQTNRRRATPLPIRSPRGHRRRQRGSGFYRKGKPFNAALFARSVWEPGRSALRPQAGISLPVIPDMLSVAEGLVLDSAEEDVPFARSPVSPTDVDALVTECDGRKVLRDVPTDERPGLGRR